MFCLRRGVLYDLVAYLVLKNEINQFTRSMIAER